MFKKTQKGYYEFNKFKKFKGLIHGFSSRKFGDMRSNKKLDNFLHVLNLQKKNLVLMEQVHGDKVKVVDEDEKGKVIPGIDGMVTNTFGIVLGVKTADCLPILFYDPIGKIIGVVHAGWRGILARIAQKVIDLMIKMGSVPSDILIGIGPYIGGCCYSADNQRAGQFLGEFGNLPSMIYSNQKGLYLDLAVPTLNQLVQSGVPKENIFNSQICTSCQNKEFFSYRKDSKKTYGEMLGIISFNNIAE
ncbi:peptidoglycan editing factor PgeF [Candidatus Shapirobacteria bacterium CG_4_9_14_0_2_um_filter_39_11]|uniref:Purine nucleoside phosphorylase n=1 Tax=Candidatus Shapirobacteria bacterium CG_4_9_14_0_2_um_filter_39_11 TaxID=1974478 RepID=A0A2M8ESC8_9BACT|nr:MAG: peptidoglycan editing factor PgeF [Candidatus Shapirobacteria bacterium CG_4_9_14_0_2_um_filter_39_11]